MENSLLSPHCEVMACLVMPSQTYISMIPFSNTDRNPKEKRIRTLLQSVNMLEYFKAA